jgi:O-succinylbenzoate synthase
LQYRFNYYPYQRSFRQPLTTSHGQWAVRQGIIISLQDAAGDRYWGEIAPIPWFGSETMAEAEDFCRSRAGQWKDTSEIPACLPACQFAWSAALLYGRGSPPQSITPDRSWSVLLPAGDRVLQSWQTPWQQGARTFKWKIGGGAIERELQLLQQLTTAMPKEAQLRLDANGGLSKPQAELWLEQCDGLPQIEFLEQPLADFGAMQALADRYRTPLALDESVSNLARLRDCDDRGWRGIFVVKPAIAGSLIELAAVIHQRQLDVVCSTSLESPIGQRAIALWAKAQGFDRRALGLGVQHWFKDDLFSVNFESTSEL